MTQKDVNDLLEKAQNGSAIRVRTSPAPTLDDFRKALPPPKLISGDSNTLQTWAEYESLQPPKLISGDSNTLQTWAEYESLYGGGHG